MALTFGTLLSSQRTNTHHHEPPHLAVRSGMTQCEHTSRPNQVPHGLAGVLSSCNALRVSSIPLWDSQAHPSHSLRGPASRLAPSVRWTFGPFPCGAKGKLRGVHGRSQIG